MISSLPLLLLTDNAIGVLHELKGKLWLPGRITPRLLRAWEKRGVEKLAHTRGEVSATWGLGGAANPSGRGTWISYHLTDDPQRSISAVQRGEDIADTRDPGKWGEIGPGIYASSAPGYWVSRSGGKWSFMDRLTTEESARLARALRDEVQALHEGYLTSSEREYALRWIDRTEEGESGPSSLIALAEQPYNIRFWRPEWLQAIDIEPGRQPIIVELELEGTFAEMSRAWMPRELFEELRDHGVSGAFTRSGFSASPQVVAWDVGAIRGIRKAPEVRYGASADLHFALSANPWGSPEG